ncbi:GL15198 [Drosophila persimilis]|uniref:GL15198 n=1 Tax=Drosophila persimilis TaxID=7234 RepID=B4H3L2_DROPE|nr:uncharacterized protein LOC6600407 [Drosophila persimilis]EDW30963.1 GL15198 [Drosophila persimilis]
MDSQRSNRFQLLRDEKGDKSARPNGKRMTTEKPKQAANTLKQKGKNETFIDLKTKQGWQRKYNGPKGYWIGGAVSTKGASTISAALGEDRKSGLDEKGESVGEKCNGVVARTPLTVGWTRLGSEVLKQSPPSPSPPQGEEQKQHTPDKVVVQQQKVRTNIRTKVLPKADAQSIADNLETPLKGGWSRLGSEVVKQRLGEEKEQQQGRCNTFTDTKVPQNDKARCNCNKFSRPLETSDTKSVLATTRRPVLVTQRAARQKHLENIEVNFFVGNYEPLGPPCGTECPKVDDEIQFPNLPLPP